MARALTRRSALVTVLALVLLGGLAIAGLTAGGVKG